MVEITHDSVRWVGCNTVMGFSLAGGLVNGEKTCNRTFIEDYQR